MRKLIDNFPARWRHGQMAFHLARSLATVLLLAACSSSGPALGPAISTATASGPGTMAAGTAGQAAPDGWRIFELPEAGYSLMLPPGVTVRSGKNTSGVYTARFQFDLPAGSGYQGIVVRVEPNPGRQDPAELVTRLSKLSALPGVDGNPAALLAGAQTLALAGLPATKVVTSGQDFTIVLSYGERAYYVAPVHDFATATLDPQAMQLFEQILATFQVSR